MENSEEPDVQTNTNSNESPSILTESDERNYELLVKWDGPDDPDCPFNWSLAEQWAITLLCSMGGMVTLMSASMLAPALSNVGGGPNSSESEANMVVSIFVLAFAFGPMALAPLAEVFGRRLIQFSSYPIVATIIKGKKTSITNKNA